MISTVALLLFLGFLVFGPKKTMEIAQEVGRFVAKVKQAAGQLQQSIVEVESETTRPIVESPTVPVTFTAGKTVLGTAQLSGGKAKLTISSMAVGSAVVTATYNGDSNIAKSSASVTQTVQ